MIDDRTDPPAGGRPGPEAAPAPARPVTPADVLTAARRHKALIGACIVGAAAAVGLGASLLKPRYVADAQVYINSRGLKIASTDITADTGDANAFTNFVESQALIVVSDKVMRLVVDGSKLYADPEFAGRLAAAPDASGFAVDQARQAAIETLKRQTTVRRPERTYVLDIAVTAQAPQRSADLANAVARGYVAQFSSSQAELAQRSTAQLAGRLAAMRQGVREAEDKVQDYKASNNLIGAGNTLVTDAQLADVNTRLTAARAHVTETQARYDQVIAAQRSPELLSALPESVGSVTIGNLRVQNVEARRQLASLSAVLGSQHPSVRAAAAQANDTGRALDAELKRIADSTRADLSRAKDAVAELGKTFDEMKAHANDAGTASVQLRELEREADAKRGVYEAYLGRSREMNELAGLDTMNVSVESEAVPPLSRSFPPRLSLMVPVGAVFGALAGLGLAVLLDRRGGRAVAEAAPAASPVEMPEAVVPAPTAPAAKGRLAALLRGRRDDGSGDKPSEAAGLRFVPPETEPALARLPAFPPTIPPGPETGLVDLTRLGLPVLGAGHAGFLSSVVEQMRAAAAGGEAACLVIAGRNTGLARSVLALNLALAARARGGRVMLMDFDAEARTLTGLAAAASPDLKLARAADGEGRLIHATRNGISLILLPDRAPFAGIDPLQICDAVFEAHSAFDLMICDGAPALTAVRRDASQGERLRVMLLVDGETPFDPDQDDLSRHPLGRRITGLVTVAEPGLRHTEATMSAA